MKVNFNNVRKQALYRYDELATKLNYAIIKDDDNYAKPNGWDSEININGYVLIDSEELDDVMNSLRMIIGTIASCYDEGNEEMIDIFSEVYPEGSDKEMVCFNPEEE